MNRKRAFRPTLAGAALERRLPPTSGLTVDTADTTTALEPIPDYPPTPMSPVLVQWTPTPAPGPVSHP